MRSTRVRIGLVAALAGAALLLSACVPEPGPSASPSAEPTTVTPSPAATPSATPSATPTSDPGATPTPTPTAGAETLVLPACVDLIPLHIVRAHFDERAAPMEVDVDPAEFMAGPAATAAARAAVQADVCTWAIPASDGGFAVIAAELTTTARDDLIAALREAGTFREGSVGGGVSFYREIDTELGLTAVTYVFEDRAWVTVTGSVIGDASNQLAAAALEGVRAANDE